MSIEALNKGLMEHNPLTILSKNPDILKPVPATVGL